MRPSAASTRIDQQRNDELVRKIRESLAGPRAVSLERPIRAPGAGYQQPHRARRV